MIGKIQKLNQLKPIENNQQQNILVINEEKTLLSGITTGIADLFSSSTINSKAGLQTNEQTQSETFYNSLIPKGATPEQARTVKECLYKIDSIISNECFFCGPILLDMIDNDVEFEGRGNEFSLGGATMQV